MTRSPTTAPDAGGADDPAPPRPVLVGVDGSPRSADAVHVAVREARLSGAPLRAVHAWLVTDPGLPLTAPAHLDAGTDARLRAAVHDHLAALLSGVDDVQVEEQVVYGFAGRVLADLSAEASLLVVGSRGLGTVRGALLGSVSHAVVERARCPVMVVHATPGDGPVRVVVGVDGSPTSLEALRWADEQAQRRDLPLLAVHAGAPHYSFLYPGPSMLLEGWEGPQVAAEHLDGWLRETLGPERAAGVARLCEARPAAALLLDNVRSDDLVVVGRRGSGGTPDLQIGSVARRLSASAPGTVVVVGSRRA